MAGAQGQKGAVLRRFVAIFAAASLLLTGTSYLIFRDGARHRAAMARDEEAHAVKMRLGAVSASLRFFASDLLLLADLNGLRGFLQDASPVHRADLTRELAAFLRQRDSYDRVRVVDASGAETARVLWNGGSPRTLPVEELGGVGGTDGLRKAADCSAGMVYVSTFCLRAESGRVVRPLMPVMTLGIALFDEGGVFAGTLLLDVLGSSIFRSLATAHPEPASVSMLLDQDGYWMVGEDSRLEWGGLVPERQGIGFQHAFPAEWQRIASAGAAQFETKNGLFTGGTVDPAAEVGDAACSLTESSRLQSPTSGDRIRWRIVSLLSTRAMLAIKLTGLAGLLASDAFGLLALGLGAWIVAERTLRNRDFRNRVVGENRILSSTLGRYLPHDISARMLRDPSRYAKLGGETQHVAVLFADIRGFTGFSETRSPEVVVAALNQALSALTSPILQHRGILDKYMGDGLLAFFEPHHAPEDAARRAMAAARDMQVAFARMEPETLGGLGLGIGISVGQVAVGNIGSEEAMNYTIVGDTVNVAARLEALAEAGEILLSEAAYELVRRDWSAVLLRSVVLKGRRQAVNVYRYLSSEE